MAECMEPVSWVEKVHSHCTGSIDEVIWKVMTPRKLQRIAR
jgi:hypothetical protein